MTKGDLGWLLFLMAASATWGLFAGLVIAGVGK